MGVLFLQTKLMFLLIVCLRALQHVLKIKVATTLICKTFLRYRDSLLHFYFYLLPFTSKIIIICCVVVLSSWGAWLHCRDRSILSSIASIYISISRDLRNKCRVGRTVRSYSIRERGRTPRRDIVPSSVPLRAKISSVNRQSTLRSASSMLTRLS